MGCVNSYLEVASELVPILTKHKNGISHQDFVAEVFLSLKEYAETDYRLLLLYRTNYPTLQNTMTSTTNARKSTKSQTA